MMKEHEAHDVLSYDEFIQMREMQRQQEKYYKKEEKYDYKEEKYDHKREEKFYKEEMESEKKKDKKDHKKKDKSSKKHKPKDKDEDKDQKEDQESDDDYWRDWDLHEHQDAKRDFHEHVPHYFAEPDFYGKPIVVPDPHHWDKDDKKKFKKMMKIDEERTPYEHKIDKKHHDDYSDDEHNVDMYHYPGGQTVVHHGESDSEDEVYCDYFGFCIHNKKDKDHHSKKHHYDDHKVDVYHYPDGKRRYVHHEDSESEDEDRHHMVPYPYY